MRRQRGPSSAEPDEGLGEARDPLAVFGVSGELAKSATSDADWLAGYRELARLGRLEETALRDIDSDASTARKAALLRVLYEVDSPATPEAFHLALRAPATRPGERPDAGDGVPAFALHHLEQRAPRDARARALLLETLTSEPEAAPYALRRRAARSLGRTTPEAEFASLANWLAAEPDSELRELALASLCQNPDAVSRPGALLGVGFAPPERVDQPTTEP